MTSLTRFEQNGIELYIDTNTHESFATQSGYARMSGKDQSTISRRLSTMHEPLVKVVEINTGSGVRPYALATEDFIVEWLPKDNPTMATQLLKLGVRSFIHQVAGYTPKKLTPTEYLIQQAYQLDAQAKQLVDHEFRLTSIEQRRLEAEQELKALPEATADVPERTLDMDINALVREYALTNDLDIWKVWAEVYRQFRDRHHVNLVQKGKNHKPKLSGVKMAVELGQIDELYAVAKLVCSTL